MNSPETLRLLLQAEMTQRTEEGHDVDDLRPRWAAATSVDDLVALYDELEQSPRRPEYEYNEPSDLPGIRVARPGGPRRIDPGLSREDLSDRILGGWSGRCAGCQLGKPCEGWPAEKILVYLTRADAYPLRFYFPERSTNPDGTEWRPGGPACCREQIRRAERDDDQDYTIFGLSIMEAHGVEFTTRQVGEGWLAKLPYHRVYTAERCAYRNLINEIGPPDSATYWNPYREWIGAQIRADFWGYLCPGAPEQAAAYAWRDAVLSHTKNGIYGEMFFAALIAAAFVTNNLHTAISYALAEIPAGSRFAEMVHDCVLWCKQDISWEQSFARVQEKYGRYHWVHTINNAALVLLALLHGKQDYEQTICYAVMGGWDTDCNGATAGSVLGVMLGAGQLPSRWIDPLHDTVASMVEGFYESRLSDLAARTTALATTTV